LAEWSKATVFENRCPLAHKSRNPSDMESCEADQAPRISALCAENAAVALLSGSFVPDLARVILAWPSLDAATRAIILSLAGHGHDAERRTAARSTLAAALAIWKNGTVYRDTL